MIAKALRSVNPADLPGPAPRKFELVINCKTPKVLGLPLPPSLLGGAPWVNNLELGARLISTACPP